ncbi:MAG: hypothetical protein C4K49_00070 [Candidatus Thorarchaeota archaeon]|nr:MAG: hypothetical protein C4K49_00070 [Candidatus Thorarchaeota archaeon]
MRKQWFIMALLVVPLLPIVVILPLALPAEAWGQSTHQFIVEEALSSITNASWADAFQYYSPEIIAGSTTPDTVWQDWDNHLYYPDTGEYAAPQAAARWFAFARNNFTLGNWEDGFKAAGVLAHYSSDPCIPVHTGPNGTAHSAYETDINDQLMSLVLQTPTEKEITNVTAFVIECATYSHQYYDTVVTAYPNGSSTAITTNSTIKALTESCLSMAVNASLCLFYTLTIGLDAPDVTITYKYVAMFDYAHTNDYIDYAGVSKLLAVNLTLARAGFEMKIQETEIDAASLADVDLLVATCGLDAYSSSELLAIANWVSGGNKSVLLTGRGDFSTYVDNARPNQILQAIGSNIRVNDDNVYMTGTYQPWYNDLTDILAPGQTVGLTESVDSITLYSPTSLYFLDDDPTLPVIYADHSGYQTDQVAPGITVVYDDTNDGEFGNQIPLVAVEEVGTLRILVAGTTFFSDFDYGKPAFDNAQFFENFLYWASNRTVGDVPVADEVGPRISDVEWNPVAPTNDQSVVFNATVSDPNNVHAVVLEYLNGTDAVTILMTPWGAEYSATIPGLQSKTIEVKVIANDTEGNIAVRAYFTLTWTAGTTTTGTTTTTTTTTSGGIIMYIIVGAAVAAVVLVVVVVFVIRRR